MRREKKYTVLRIPRMIMQEGKEEAFYDSMRDECHLSHARRPKLFLSQGIDHFLPQHLCDILKLKHNTIFGSIPICQQKPLNWKAALNTYLKAISCSRFRTDGYPENFRRTAHVEVNVPGTGPVSGYYDVFFNPYTPDNYIGKRCALKFGLKPQYGVNCLIREVRWHVEEDKRLKNPWLHFNHLKYEEGDFFYAEFLEEFDLVIGWNMIQELQLLSPKDDIAAAGEGFCRLPRPVDQNAARLNQAAVARAREKEWERINQHADRKAREASSSASTANRN